MPKNEIHLQVFTAEDKHIGHFDGEFFYTNPPINLRVDGDEVYTRNIPTRFVGNITGSRIQLLDGSVPYYFSN